MKGKILSSIIALPALAAAASYSIYHHHVVKAFPDPDSTSYRLTTNTLPVLVNQLKSQPLLISASDEADDDCRPTGLCPDS